MRGIHLVALACALPMTLGLRPAPLPPQQPASAVTEANRKAYDIVEQVLAAMGGDSYLTVKYRSGSGRIYSFQSTGELADAGQLFWNFSRFPDAERIELTKQRNVVEIFAGNQGWEITYKGVASQPQAALNNHLELRAHSLDTVLRTVAADPQTMFIYLGLGQIDQDQVQQLQLVTRAGETIGLDVSYLTHLPVRVHWRKDDTLTGGHFDQNVTYGGWTKIDGVETPFSVLYAQGTRRVQQTNYDQASYLPLSDSLFEPKPLKR